MLSLEPLTEFEQQELQQIWEDFDNYLAESKVDEGLVKALTTFPLMRLAGFYHSPIKITLEEDIAKIEIEDEETKITGQREPPIYQLMPLLTLMESQRGIELLQVLKAICQL